MPIAQPDQATTTTDMPVTIAVLANDVGQDLTIRSISKPRHGAVLINLDDTVTYSPASGYIGGDRFRYSVRDLGGRRSWADVVVAVEPLAAPIVANDDFVTTLQGDMVTVPVLANDQNPGGHALSVQSVGEAAHGSTVVGEDRTTISYLPDDGFVGADTFSYVVADGFGGEDSATVFIDVTARNRAPIAVDDQAGTARNMPVTIDVLANDTDPDGDALAISSVTMPDHGTISINTDNTVIYQPEDGFIGSDGFGYVVVDGRGGQAEGRVSVVIADLNSAPVALDDSISTDVDQPITFMPMANDGDADGDVLVIAGLGAAANGMVAVNADQSLTYTPDPGFIGDDAFTYTVEDGRGGSASATVSVVVADVVSNQPPVAVDDSVTTDQDVPVTFDVLGNDSDPDGGTLGVAGVTVPANGAAVINGDGTITYTPNAGYFGADSFGYTVEDGQGGSASAVVSVVVVEVVSNQPPVAIDDSVITDQDVPVTIDVLANDSDADGGTLSVTGVTVPANGAAVSNGDGTITYTPNAGYFGADSFGYTVEDGQGGSANATASVVVVEVVSNQPPVVVDDSATTDQDVPVTIDVLANDSDADGGTLSVTGVTVPANGAAVSNGDGTVTYTPDAGYSGADSFGYTVEDGQGGGASGTVVITIRAQTAPVASDDAATTLIDVPVTINVLSNDTDADNDLLTVTASTTPTSGSVVINPDSTMTYTPNALFEGSDAFDYTISDGRGGNATARVNVAVVAGGAAFADGTMWSDGTGWIA